MELELGIVDDEGEHERVADVSPLSRSSVSPLIRANSARRHYFNSSRLC